VSASAATGRLDALRARLRDLAHRARHGWRRPQRRAFLRHAVDCEARLDVEAGTLHVRLRDVSEGGALLELADPLEPGARAQLRFPHLPGRPAVWCVVQHAVAQDLRFGVQFQGDPEANARLALILVRLHGRPPATGG
jgi:PilZ domain